LYKYYKYKARWYTGWLGRAGRDGWRLGGGGRGPGWRWLGGAGLNDMALGWGGRVEVEGGYP